MQNSLFETSTEVGVYVPPKPKQPGKTPLALIELERLLERLRPILPENPMFARPWLVTIGNNVWSVACAGWMMVAVKARSDEVVPIPFELRERQTLLHVMLNWQKSDDVREMNFEQIARPAGEAQWPRVCSECYGRGWVNCCKDNFCAECFEWDGVPPCDACEQDGYIAPSLRVKRLAGRRIEMNILACGFEILRPVVAPDSLARVWDNPLPNYASVCFEGEGWRLLTMALQEQRR